MGLKKRIAIILGAAILVATTAVVVPAILRNRPKAPVKLTAYFHLYASPSREQLASMLDEFMVFYPHIELEYHIEPYQDMRKLLISHLDNPDAVGGVVSVLTGKDLDLLPEGAPPSSTWISSAWGLYYNSEVLEALGFTRDDLVDLSSSGFDIFIDELDGKISGNETLFAVGTSFFWPWLAWVQHLELLAGNGGSPVGFTPAEWAIGIADWGNLVSEGLVNADFKDLNFAASQLAVSEGKALFVLSDSSIYSTFRPESRGVIESVPFPGSLNQGWRVGSGIQLGSFSNPDLLATAAEAEELLLNYLHSEGIADRFLTRTGIRLLPRVEDTDVREIPSLTQRAGEPEMQDLLKYLR